MKDFLSILVDSHCHGVLVWGNRNFSNCTPIFVFFFSLIALAMTSSRMVNSHWYWFFDGDIKLVQPLVIFTKFLNMKSPWLAVPSKILFFWNSYTCVQRSICKDANYSITCNRKIKSNLKCPLAGEWFNKLWYSQTLDHYAAIKREVAIYTDM